MKYDALKLLGDINRAVIQFRGVYSAWSKKHGISYNEMLVLYTIRDNGFCTQKTDLRSLSVAEANHKPRYRGDAKTGVIDPQSRKLYRP